LKEIAAKEGLTQKLVIPPGPNNPVGVNWIGLNRPGYGIHGTAVPSQIGQAVSHGCIRLANWNVLKFRQMVRVGSEINVVW
jgi:lipoprotein-anchoring transpeptidase ErfK/SrfK